MRDEYKCLDKKHWTLYCADNCNLWDLWIHMDGIFDG